MNLPQMYWRDIGVSPAKIMQDTYRANRALGRPVYPIGQTWNNPGTGQLKAFQAAAKAAGAPGISWWDWSQTSRKSWSELDSSNAFIVQQARAIHPAASHNPVRVLAHALKPINALVGTLTPAK